MFRLAWVPCWRKGHGTGRSLLIEPRTRAGQWRGTGPTPVLQPWMPRSFNFSLLLTTLINQRTSEAHRSDVSFCCWRHTLLQIWPKPIHILLHTYSLTYSLVSEAQRNKGMSRAGEPLSASGCRLSYIIPWLVVNHSSSLPQIHCLLFFKQNFLYPSLLMTRLWFKCEGII